MNIVHVITTLQKASGVTTFVENVVREQRALGHTVDICTNESWSEKLEFEKGDIRSPTPTHNSNYDIMHIHGLWSPLLHRASLFARNHHIPVVWSTHGMTAPWSLHHKWWKKAIPWCLYQKPDLKRAALIHCTTDLEADWNHALGFANTFIAPLGTNLPCRSVEDVANSTVDLHLPPTPKTKALLYVGRIYPVKALDNLIKAFALAVKEFSRVEHGERVDWVLRIVGPDQAGHKAELLALCESLGVPYADNSTDSGLAVDSRSEAGVGKPNRSKFACAEGTCVQFVGPRYDADLDAEYENCTALTLVSHTENFGVTVVDALAHAKPVITSTNTPWKIVSDRQCGWWCSNDSDDLGKIILQLFNSSTSQLSQMGVNGRALVEQQFTWPAIAKNLITQYESVVRHD